MPFPKVAIVYLSYHCEDYLGDALAAFQKVTYPRESLELVFVDNPHPQFGSSEKFLRDTITSTANLPHSTILPQTKNLGFAGGVNAGIKWAIENGFDYVYLHNQDGLVKENFLEPLVTAMQNDPTIGAAQSLILLHSEPDLVNTSGNMLQYLGVGYSGNFKAKVADLNLPALYPIGYASGSAVLLRSSLLKQFGLFDEDYYLYHEDLEYSLRLKTSGHKIVAVRDSIFFHKYSFNRNLEKFYYIERNRLGLLFTYYRPLTLLLLLPLGIIYEAALSLFALQQGWFLSKGRSYEYWLNPAVWPLWWAKRRRIQALRTVPDSLLIKEMVSPISFAEGGVDNVVLRYLGNPLLIVYGWFIRFIIFW